MSGPKQREGSRVFPDEDSSGFAHDEQAGFSLFLQERCKRIFFIRHAEGFHNVGERESTMDPQNLILKKEYSGDKYWDARLTPKGEQQCAQLKASVRGNTVWGFDRPLNLDLVVTSPLTRTLQTAVLSLGSPDSAGAPLFIAHEDCRERISESMCDGRSSITDLKKGFPGVDFSLVQHDQDWRFHNEKENDWDCQARARRFLMWLCGRPEIHIAVVTHSLFLRNLLSQFGDNVSVSDREAIHKFPTNAELRSIMLCAHRPFSNAGAEGSNSKQLQPAPKMSFRALWNGAPASKL